MCLLYWRIAESDEKLRPSVSGTWFPGYHWIYWVGLFLGAAVSAGYYRFVKYFNYKEANPGQDSATNDFVVD